MTSFTHVVKHVPFLVPPPMQGSLGNLKKPKELQLRKETKLGSSCSTAVERTPANREAVGSIPSQRVLGFYLLSYFALNRSLEEVQQNCFSY